MHLRNVSKIYIQREINHPFLRKDGGGFDHPSKKSCRLFVFQLLFHVIIRFNLKTFFEIVGWGRYEASGGAFSNLHKLLVIKVAKNFVSQFILHHLHNFLLQLYHIILDMRLAEHKIYDRTTIIQGNAHIFWV